MKKLGLAFLLVLFFVNSALYAGTFHVTEDEKLVNDVKLTGSYRNSRTTGNIEWGLSIDKNGVARFRICEDGRDTDITTSSEDLSVQRSTIYELELGTGTEKATGKLRKGAAGNWNEIEVPGGGKTLSRYKGHTIALSSKYGTYSLGSIDTSEIESFLFTRKLLDEALAYLNSENYELALDTFRTYKSESPESYEFYEVENRVTECERRLAKTLYDKAVSLKNEGRYFEALSRIEELYRSYPAFYKRYKANVLEQECRGINLGTRFNVALTVEPLSLDPHYITMMDEQRIAEAMFEGLVSSDPKTAEAIPAAAEAWDISADGKTVVFHIRKGLVWSDGTPLNSNDFIYSWLRCLDPETASPYAWLLAMFIEGAEAYHAGTAPREAVQIEAPDNYTLKVRLSGNYPYFIGALTYTGFAAVPRHAIEKYGKDWTKSENIVCNGAYTVDEYILGDHILLKKNENYWEKQYVNLDEVNFIFFSKNEDAYKKYLSGDIDWVTDAPKGSNIRTDFQSFEVMSSHYYTVNTQKSYLSNSLVRRALSMTIDRDSVVELLSDSCTPSWGIVPEMDDYTSITQPSYYTDDYARSLLERAGYKNGQGLPELTILSFSSEKVDKFVARDWKDKLGIECRIEKVSWEELQNRLAAGDFDLALSGWAGDYQDPTTFLNIFLSTSGMNDGKYSSKSFDNLLMSASRTTNNKSRMNTLKWAEEELINKDAAVFAVVQDTAGELINTKKWGGWYPNVMDVHPVKEIYLK